MKMIIGMKFKLLKRKKITPALTQTNKRILFNCKVLACLNIFFIE